MLVPNLSLTYPSIAVLALVVAVFLSKSYKALNGPLAHLPGPTISKWTNLRYQYAVLMGDRTQYVASLHAKYGPLVRCSPNELSTIDRDAAKKIYKMGSGFLKTDFYFYFTGAQPVSPLFGMRDPKEHSQHRQLTSAFFAEKNVKKLEPYIADNVRRAIVKIDQDANRLGYCDVFKWFTFMVGHAVVHARGLGLMITQATDVIGEASFGENFNMIDSGKVNEYIEDLESVANRSIYFCEFPELIKVLRRIPFGPFKKLTRTLVRIGGHATELINAYWRQLKADPDNVKPTLLTKEYEYAENGMLSTAQLARDAMGYMVAGTDTTAITLTYVVWVLSRHPEIESALIREVATLEEGFTDDDLKPLKLMDNVINETLRLHAPVQQGLPRTVPRGGTEMCGYHIPESVTVGAQAHGMHRDPLVWANPEQFDPARWNNLTPAAKDMFLPWGGGNRVCIGMHFAQLEMRHALAHFYRTFTGGMKVSSAEGFSDADMQQHSWFLEQPKTKRCLLERRK